MRSFGGPLRFTEHRDTDGEAYYQATWSNVLALGFGPKMYSAIDGTQISSRNSSTGQLRSESCRIQSRSGSRSFASPARR
jgi:hypothetical protein